MSAVKKTEKTGNHTERLLQLDVYLFANNNSSNNSYNCAVTVQLYIKQIR